LISLANTAESLYLVNRSGNRPSHEGAAEALDSERLVPAGFDAALERKRHATPPTPRKLDGVGEAKLIAMRLGKPPAGYGRWSLRLLADELVVLDVVPSIRAETVRETLKKPGWPSFLDR
jgi:hypothetical protein